MLIYYCKKITIVYIGKLLKAPTTQTAVFSKDEKKKKRDKPQTELKISSDITNVTFVNRRPYCFFFFFCLCDVYFRILASIQQSYREILVLR